MRTIYINPEGQEVMRPKQLKLSNGLYMPPTDEQLISAGWEIREIIDPIPEPYIPTYAELVEQYIREHGYPTYGAELAILNNYAQDPMTYADAYAAYMQTRTDAKNWAWNEPHREDEV